MCFSFFKLHRQFIPFHLSSTSQLILFLHLQNMYKHCLWMNTHTDIFLPSYTALKPCALTAKSVVNHRASMEPLLTIGEGSMNPDNLQTESSVIMNNVFLQICKTTDFTKTKRRPFKIENLRNYLKSVIAKLYSARCLLLPTLYNSAFKVQEPFQEPVLLSGFCFSPPVISLQKQQPNQKSNEKNQPHKTAWEIVPIGWSMNWGWSFVIWGCYL